MRSWLNQIVSRPSAFKQINVRGTMPHLWKTASLIGARILGSCLAQLSPDEIEGIAHHYAQRSNTKHNNAMQVFSSQIINPSMGEIYNPDMNGENEILRRTSRLNFQIIFDVGANNGDWAKRARIFHPNSIIHCFEIVPETFKVLARNISNKDNIILNEFGLLDMKGTVPVYLGDQSVTSTTQKFHRERSSDVVNCAVTTGEEYTRSKEIGFIDFVKIDVEGAESKVISGFGALLESKKIRLIQFEYNRGAIASRFLLADFYEFFTEKGYILGKLTKEGVLFRNYAYAHENFSGPNYVACCAGDQVLRDAIAV